MPPEKRIIAFSSDLLLMQEFDRLRAEYGVEISMFSNQEEILAAIEKDTDGETLLLIEVSGAGRAGIALAEAAKERFATLQIIAFSKIIAPDTVRRAKNAGIQHIVTQEQLLSMLPQIVRHLQK